MSEVIIANERSYYRLPGVMYLDCHTNLALQVRYAISTIMYVSKPINKFKIARVRSNHCSKSSHHAISESKPTERRLMVFRKVVANSLHFVIFVFAFGYIVTGLQYSNSCSGEYSRRQKE